MSRETQRQATRLRTLANFIAENPKAYDQTSPWECIVGLGSRMTRGKLTSKENYINDNDNNGVGAYMQRFSERFGVSTKVVNAIFLGAWKQVDKRSKNTYEYSGKYEQRRGAVRLLNNLAKKVESGIKLA